MITSFAFEKEIIEQLQEEGISVHDVVADGKVYFNVEANFNVQGSSANLHAVQDTLADQFQTYKVDTAGNWNPFDGI